MAADEREAGTRETIRELFLLMKTVLTHGPEHPLAGRHAGALVTSIGRAGPPFDLQFVDEAVFRDRELVPFEVEEFLRAAELARAASGMGADELAFERVPDAATLVTLGGLLAEGSRGARAERDTLPGLRWRAIQNAMWGEDAEDVDPDVFCATHLALAVEQAERLLDGGPWPMRAGVSVVRRLELTARAGGPAMARCLEIAPGTWSPARRAVSATHWVLAAGHALGAQRAGCRAAAHVTLVVACSGLAEGLPATQAARRGLERLLGATKAAEQGNLSPHRLRVCAMLEGLLREERAPGEWPVPPGVVHLAYELERRRLPEGVTFQLTFADLLAQAAEEMGSTFEERAVRALVLAAGELPPGAFVRLADGRAGIVLEAGASGDPLRPRVLVGSVVVEPPAAVRLLSPVEVGRLGA